MSGLLLVLAATPLEQDLLRRSLGQAEGTTLAHRDALSGQIKGRDVTLLETGIGLVNAAQALTGALASTSPPRLVLQVGVGGAYPGSGLSIGDIAVATEEHYGDLGVYTADGWLSAEAFGIPLLKADRDYFNTFPLNAALVSKAQDLIQGTPSEGTAPLVRKGPFVTVQQSTGVAARGRELAERFRALCENMEGAAAAHICTLYEVPFLEVRGISNPAEDRDRTAWDLPLAAGRAQEAALNLIAHLDVLLEPGP